MNDRYLFRGKREDNGEWIVGDLSQWNDGDMYICRQHRQFDEEYEVIPETVGQCTGLKDKNGKLIFEGDILSFDKVRGVVGYESGCYVFRWRCFNRYGLDRLKQCILTDHAGFDNLEIIGNIHNNPELLEVKE